VKAQTFPANEGPTDRPGKELLLKGCPLRRKSFFAPLAKKIADGRGTAADYWYVTKSP